MPRRNKRAGSTALVLSWEQRQERKHEAVKRQLKAKARKQEELIEQLAIEASYARPLAFSSLGGRLDPSLVSKLYEEFKG